jgi:hypothetical protein
MAQNYINDCLMYSNNPFEIVYDSWLWPPNFKVIDQTKLKEV